MQQEQRNQAIGQVDQKIKQLESVETYLVEQLSKTQRTQQKALENLHSVVQLCNKQISPSPSGVSLHTASKH